MTRLLLHVEGQTEETFVNEVLRPYLIKHGFSNVSARIVGNPRKKRGGIKPWKSVRQEIISHLNEDAGAISSLLVDYYGLPGDSKRGWPGRNEASLQKFEDRAQHVESQIYQDLEKHTHQAYRFVPYIIMHEFEALLFSDCTVFANAIGRNDLAANFQNIRNKFSTPEEINDSKATAPSKRILKLMPTYNKPLFGTIAAIEISIERIRSECPQFDLWLKILTAKV